MTRHSALLTNLLLGIPVATGLLCAAPNASAQKQASVKIPFAFTANNYSVPAGSYTVALDGGRFITLRNTRTMKTQILMVRPEEGRVIESQSRLTFHLNGGRYYLGQIWLAGTNVHSEMVARPKLVQEVAQAIPPSDATVEVALK